MREPNDSPAQRGRSEKDESVLGFSDLASLPAFIYLLFFLFVLVVFSANPFEPQVFGFYKLSVFFQVIAFFSIFFVPTLLIYFALDLTKNTAHSCIVLGYPLLVLGGVAILNVADSPLLAALSGLVLFAFYFFLGLSRSATERQRRTLQPVVRPTPLTQARLRCHHNNGLRTGLLLFRDSKRHDMRHLAVLKNLEEMPGPNMEAPTDLFRGSIGF